MIRQPFRPEDFDEECETCGAAPGQLCLSWCDTGYTADDYHADAEH
ncbi:zinc finger domain-containing protein [Streptomyces sp. NPDC002403]